MRASGARVCKHLLDGPWNWRAAPIDKVELLKLERHKSRPMASVTLNEALTKLEKDFVSESGMPAMESGGVAGGRSGVSCEGHH